MKTKFSLMLSALLLSSPLFAKDASSEIAKLQKQLEQISKELAELKKAQAKHDAEYEELSERADEVEFEATLNKVKFGLEFSTALSNTNYKVGSRNYSANNKWANELHLNMFADINDDTKFYGRLSMTKNWGDMAWRGTPYDMDAGRDPSGGPALYVSRAYVDYRVTPELIATIGRQPGTEGPGSNLRNNALRQSTYPALLINALGDAVVVTYKPESLSEHKVALRGGVGKIYQWDQDGDIRDWSADQEVADSNLYYAAAEGELPLGEWGSHNLLILNAMHLSDFSLPFYNNALTNLGTIPTLPDYRILNEGVHNIGDITIANIHFENYDTMGLPLHYFVSLGYSYGANNMLEPNLIGGVVPAPDEIKNFVKINEEEGYSTHVGLRYDFTQALKLGYEFFWGSQYWYALSRPSIHDPLNIRMTRGTAHDVYAIWQLDRYQFLRLSYTNVQNKFGNRGLPFGGASKEKSRADNIMLMYNLRF